MSIVVYLTDNQNNLMISSFLEVKLKGDMIVKC